MGKLIPVALLAALLQMLWGFLYWSLSPIAGAATHPFPMQAAVMEALQEAVPASGVYTFPFHESDAAGRQEFERLHLEGPVGQLFIMKEGRDPNDPMVFLFGYIHFFVSCWMMAAIVSAVLPAVPTFGARYGLIIMVGVFALFFQLFGNPIWWGHPWTFHFFVAFFDLVGWLLAGFVIAKLVKPPASPPLAPA